MMLKKASLLSLMFYELHLPLLLHCLMAPKHIIPVDSVAECIRIGKQIECITAGERDGQVAEGLAYGNSPFEYPREFIKGKTLVLTTTNGTKLLTHGA